MTDTIATRLATARKEQGLTQQQVANALGVSRAAVGQWESGITEPSVRNLKAINDLLKLDIRAISNAKSTDDPYYVAAWRFLSRRDLDKIRGVDLPIDLVCVGSKAECMPINGSEDHAIDYVPRPQALLNDPAASAMIIATDALSPRFEQEEIIYLSSTEDPVASEYGMIVFITIDAKVKTYLGRVVQIDEKQIALETFKPPLVQNYARKLVPKIYRVVPWNELLNDREDRRARVG